MLNRASSDRGAELIAQARQLGPLIEAAAERIEQDRAIPQDVLSGLHDARLFRLLIPRSCGGEEVEPVTFFQAVEAIAMADASTAWCLGQGCGVSFAAAYLKPAVAREIFGPARAVVASGPNTSAAKAIAVDGGYRVSGRWTFASGMKHAQWLGAHCIVCERDGTPRLGADGKPIDRTMLFPKSSATITDVWHVMGLRGTGSDDYAVDDLFVPADYSFTRESPAERRESGPLYRFSIFNMFGLGFSAVALGIARQSLDDFIRLAGEKTPYGSAKPLRDNGVIQSQVGFSQARLQAARTLVLDTFRRLWEDASQGATFSMEQRINNRIATCYAIHQAREVVDFIQHAAGATSIFEGNPFERRFRDLRTVTQQGQAHFSNFETFGQMLLGLQPTIPRG